MILSLMNRYINLFIDINNNDDDDINNDNNVD